MKRFKEFVKDQAAKYKDVELGFSAKYEKGKIGLEKRRQSPQGQHWL